MVSQPEVGGNLMLSPGEERLTDFMLALSHWKNSLNFRPASRLGGRFAGQICASVW